jgi:hypothetical protein
MISELNQPARIASLECGLVKIPCPLKASDDKTPSTSGLLDLHASGREELTTGRLDCEKNRHNRRRRARRCARVQSRPFIAFFVIAVCRAKEHYRILPLTLDNLTKARL